MPRIPTNSCTLFQKRESPNQVGNDCRNECKLGVQGRQAIASCHSGRDSTTSSRRCILSKILPRRHGTSPVPGQDPIGLHGGVEDVQPRLQRRSRWVARRPLICPLRVRVVMLSIKEFIPGKACLPPAHSKSTGSEAALQVAGTLTADALTNSSPMPKAAFLYPQIYLYPQSNNSGIRPGRRCASPPASSPSAPALPSAFPPRRGGDLWSSWVRDRRRHRHRARRPDRREGSLSALRTRVSTWASAPSVALATRR